MDGEDSLRSFCFPQVLQVSNSTSEKNHIYSFEGDIPKELPVEIQSNEISGI